MLNFVALSEAATIALHSMVLIAQSETRLNVIQISELIGSSRHHVAKVMQRLSKENLVSSNRGPTGGFILKQDPSQIRLIDIYEAIEGKMELCNCPGNKATCPFGNCILGDLTNKLGGAFKEHLETKTLADYIDK
jgi:Rrf2 family protein